MAARSERATLVSADDAIGHLRVAIDKRPSLRDLAKEDSDFDTIREEPGFQQLVGATQP